jgi:hypothetical protein
MEFRSASRLRVGLSLILAARITLAHFSVSSAMSLPNSAREPERAAPVREARFDHRIGKPGVDLLVQLVDDFRGRISGRTNTEEGAHLIARHEFADGRDVGQRLRARRGRSPPLRGPRAQRSECPTFRMTATAVQPAPRSLRSRRKVPRRCHSGATGERSCGAAPAGR